MAAVTVASVATAVECPAAAADCSCVVTALTGTVPAAAEVSDLHSGARRQLAPPVHITAHSALYSTGSPQPVVLNQSHLFFGTHCCSAPPGMHFTSSKCH